MTDPAPDTAWAHTLATAFEAGLLGAGDDLPDTWADTYDPEDPADDALLAGRAIGRRILGLDPEWDAGIGYGTPARIQGQDLDLEGGARCSECLGLGILWDQTYGHAVLLPGEVCVQRCDACGTLDDDEAAARAAAEILSVGYRFALPEAFRLVNGVTDPPGDFAVPLPDGMTLDELAITAEDVARARFG